MESTFPIQVMSHSSEILRLRWAEIGHIWKNKNKTITYSLLTFALIVGKNRR